MSDREHVSRLGRGLLAGRPALLARFVVVAVTHEPRWIDHKPCQERAGERWRSRSDHLWHKKVTAPRNNWQASADNYNVIDAWIDARPSRRRVASQVRNSGSPKSAERVRELRRLAGSGEL